MTTFVAIGDSVTVGLGDPMPGGGWRGWAGLLAGSFEPGAALHNLAENGATISELPARQLPKAVELRPDVAAVLAGVNDTLRGRFDLAGIAAGFDTVVADLTRSGAVVLTASLPDPGLMLRIPELMRRPLARRIHAINTVVEETGRRYGAVHVDMAAHPALYQRTMWGVDRLHPSEAGHRLLARLFHAELAASGYPIGAPPGAEPTGTHPTAWQSALWMATKGTGWVARRATDFLPHLARLVTSEAWHQLRGRTIVLDSRYQAEIDGVLTEG
ncbi:SGNH/GDSL hydrolase family protein [Streptosporangiaceae bacterium NEAU-GS5]|nr:SGNH/GDSL hydrolase family protein [Streptosporangiaceae bacterium NEAU-GS5]